MTKFHLNFIELEKVNSTNTYAINLLKSHEIPEGTVIRALEQFEGKGQGENEWESESGKNLTFSLILHPVFLPPEKQFFLNEAIALGVLDFTKAILSNEENSLKWPNDIYVGNRKLGGILINNIISGNIFETSIPGVGLNINQNEFSLRIPNPVSMKMLLENEIELRPALIILCESLKNRYHQLRKGEFKRLYDDYCNNLLGYNSWRDYLIGEKQISGKITGVTENGRLMVQTEEMQMQEFDHHQIEFLF